MKLKHLSLFSGIGGPDLAAEWMGWENISHTEWNPFGQRVLQYYWPNATSHHDITKTDYTIYRGRVDILTGGFPCQGFSLAGKRMGTDDDRYLWPEMRRAYNECRPRVIIGENVTGLLSMEDKSGVYRDVFPKVEGRTIVRTLEADHYEAVYTRQAKMLIDSICNDLEEDGYEVQPFVIPAAACGAPHKRERVWIVAYANDARSNGRSRNNEKRAQENKGWQKQPQFEPGQDGNDGNASDSDGDGYGCNDRSEQTGCAQEKSESIGKERQRVRGVIRRIGAKKNAADTDDERFGQFIASEKPGKQGFFNRLRFEQPKNWHNFPTQSPVCNGNDGFSARLDPAAFLGESRKPLTYSKWRNESIKAGGNAIVPQVIYQFFKAIDELLSQEL